jgi:uncharacterized protein (UPF0333 family)
VKGTTIALVLGGVAVVGIGGYFIWKSHEAAVKAQEAAAKAASGSKNAASTATKILNLAPEAISLGQKIAKLF